jgi:integrase
MPSVYKRGHSKYYGTDIWIDGVKFSRSTKKTSEREASAAAIQIEKDLRASIAAAGVSQNSLRLDHVAERYMRDVGDHHAGEGAAITQSKVALVLKFFEDKYGPDIDLPSIDHDKATALLNWRRKHRVGEAAALLDATGKTKVRKGAKVITAYTINDTTEQLKKLFTYAKARKAVLPNAPDFGKYGGLWIKESKSRPRVLSTAESDNLDQASATVRADYDPLVQFSRVTGKRKSECLLQWPWVKWDRGIIILRGKGDKEIIIAITPTIRAILWPLQGHHPDFVFTYVAQRTTEVRRKGGVVKLVAGQRYPITKDSLRRVWGTIRKAANIPTTGPDRVRWHDLRHDFASKLLASIPTADGMKIVQEALGHAKITTTMGTYAHVSADRVADAIEEQAQARLQRRAGNHRSGHRSRSLKSV